MQRWLARIVGRTRISPLILRILDRSHDPMIDALIAQAGAKPRPGMEHVDWHRLNHLGQRRWAEVEAAQRRWAAAAAPTTPPRYRLIRRCR